MAPTHTLRVNDLFTQPQKSPRKCGGFDAHHSLMPTISLVEAELFPGACCVLAVDYTRSALRAGVFDDVGSVEANTYIVEDRRLERHGLVVVSLEEEGLVGGDSVEAKTCPPPKGVNWVRPAASRLT